MTTPEVSEPQQERSRRSFAKVKEACLALLLETGGTSFTLADISATAKVSIGSIYGRVGNKANLIRLVQTEELDRIDGELTRSLRTAAATERSFDHAVGAVITATVEPLAQNAATIRAFMRLGDDDPEAAERGSQSWEVGRDEFCAALATIATRFAVSTSLESREWCHEVVYSVTARQLGFGLTPGGLPPVAIETSALEVSLSRTARLILRD